MVNHGLTHEALSMLKDEERVSVDKEKEGARLVKEREQLLLTPGGMYTAGHPVVQQLTRRIELEKQRRGLA